MIAGKTQFGTVLEDPGQAVEVFPDNEAALVLPLFRPRVGKQDKRPIN